MPLDPTTAPASTTPEQNRTVGKFGEKTTIDPNTFEIRGVDSGTVFGKGESMGEALALQTQGASGGTPTVKGRPDLYAVAPTAGEEAAGIQDVNIADEGQPAQFVAPRTATTGELDARVAGTLQTAQAERAPVAPDAPKPPSALEKPVTDYATAMKDAVSAGAQAGVDAGLNAPDSYDNKILTQKGIIMAALLGDAVTPDDLKFLSPQQQAAVRGGKKSALEAELVGLNAIATGRKELKIAEEEKAARQFDKFLESGTPLDQLPEGYLNQLDDTMGLPRGMHASIYKTKVAASEAEQKNAEMEAAQNLVGLLNDIPAGQEITIDGVTYSGFDTSNIQSGMEINQNTGEGVMWEYDELTGAYSKISIGQVGSAEGWVRQESSDGVIYYENENTGARKLAINGGAPNGGTSSGLVASFPDRSVTPYNRSEARGGKWTAAQCGAWVNDVTGLGVGDSYQSKKNKMNPDITSDNSTVGDVVIMPYSSTGHIGIINSKYEVDGELYYRLSESNWSKNADGIGLITHSRSVKASTIEGYARPGFTENEFSFGTDAPESAGADLYALDRGAVDTEDQKAPTVKKINDVDMQWNPTTGYWDRPNIKSTPESVERDNEKSDKTLRLVETLQGLDQKKLDKWIGPIAKLTPGPLKTEARVDFEKDVEQLKNFLTLDNLSLMTGILTDKDIELLSTAATQLNTEGSVEAFNEELQVILDEFNSESIAGPEDVPATQADTDYLSSLGY